MLYKTICLQTSKQQLIYTPHTHRHNVIYLSINKYLYIYRYRYINHPKCQNTIFKPLPLDFHKCKYEQYNFHTHKHTNTHTHIYIYILHEIHKILMPTSTSHTGVHGKLTYTYLTYIQTYLQT